MESRIMIAGLTRPADAALAVSLGATYLSCELFPESPRCVSASQANEVLQGAEGRGLTRVIHLHAATAEEIQAAATEAGTRHVMVTAFDELAAQEVEKSGLTIYRVHEVPTGTNLLPPMDPDPTKSTPAVLTVSASVNGLSFPWEILGTQAPEATFIGGFVTPENVCALRTHHPYGIIVNSGVEHQPGLKDTDRMNLLFDQLENGF